MSFHRTSSSSRDRATFRHSERGRQSIVEREYTGIHPTIAAGVASVLDAATTEIRTHTGGDKIRQYEPEITTPQRLADQRRSKKPESRWHPQNSNPLVPPLATRTAPSSTRQTPKTDSILRTRNLGRALYVTTQAVNHQSGADEPVRGTRFLPWQDATQLGDPHLSIGRGETPCSP